MAKSSDFLGQAGQISWHHHAALGMLPAHQCFDARHGGHCRQPGADSATASASSASRAHICLKRGTSRNHGLHLGIEEAHVIAPDALARKHRKISCFSNSSILCLLAANRVTPMLWVCGTRNLQLVLVEHGRLSFPATSSRRRLPWTVRSIFRITTNSSFAQSRHRIPSRTQDVRRWATCCNSRSPLWWPSVYSALEIIEVYEHQRPRFLLVAGCQGMLQPVKNRRGWVTGYES